MCNDYEIRADNNNLKSLKSMLTESLEKRAISHCSVGLTDRSEGAIAGSRAPSWPEDGSVGVGVFPECEPTQRLPIHARLTVLPELARAGLHR